MTRKPKRRSQPRSKAADARKPARQKKPVRRKSAKHPTAAPADALDTLIVASLRALELPSKKAWHSAIKANLQVTLQLAKTLAEFDLPDDAEPAPVFRA